MISVILANYNGSQYLAAAMESVLTQSYDDFEFIVVDDGSTDTSREIIQSLAIQHPVILKPVYLTENRGQGPAFTEGLKHAKGEIVCLIDSDDIWFPEKLSGVFRHFSENPQHAVFQHNLRIMNDNRLSEETFRDILTVGDYFGYTRRKKVLPQFIPTTGLSFNRKMLNKVLPIPTGFRTCADGYLTRTAFCFGEVGSTNNCWGAYRVHGSNNTYANPEYSNQKYLNQLLIPALNQFYRNNNIDFQFHDRLFQLHKTLDNLDINGPVDILMFRCAAIETTQDIISSIFKINPEATIDLLIQPSFRQDFNDEKIHHIEVNEGFLTTDSITADCRKRLANKPYQLGIIPYSINNPLAYHNVHSLISSLNTCPFYGIDYDGFPYLIDPVTCNFKKIT